MDVSVIIVNYNTYELTHNCIKSIFSNTSRLSFEVILVDNNSTDQDPDNFKNQFKDLILIKSRSNLGFAKGNNLGIEHAKGDYILLLNSDTLLINNAIYEAYKILKNNPDIGVLTGKQLDMNNNILPAAHKFPSIKSVLIDLFRISRFFSLEKRRNNYLGTQADYSKEIECDWVSGSFFMFPSSLLNSFPENKLHDSFFMYYEDVQWCYYIKRKLKKKILYSPNPQFYHINSASDNLYKNNVEKFFKLVLPNEYIFLHENRGIFYVKIYYLIKSIHFLTLRNKLDLWKAKQFFNKVFN